MCVCWRHVILQLITRKMIDVSTYKIKICIQFWGRVSMKKWEKLMIEVATNRGWGSSWVKGYGIRHVSSYFQTDVSVSEPMHRALANLSSCIYLLCLLKSSRYIIAVVNCSSDRVKSRVKIINNGRCCIGLYCVGWPLCYIVREPFPSNIGCWWNHGMVTIDLILKPLFAVGNRQQRELHIDR